MTTFAPQPGSVPRVERELVPSDSPLAPFISVNPGRMHGEPCFKDSRVPISILFGHLKAGDPLDVFLEDFPSITRERAAAVIELAARGLLEGLRQL